MGFESEGISELKMRLQRLADVPAIATAELSDCADDLQQKARDMAPIDYGDLKDAIMVNEVGGSARNAKGQFMKGALREFIVYVKNDRPLQHPTNEMHVVGDYAWKVHEYMGWGSNVTTFMPSEKSVIEGEMHGVEAGGKFLERAMNELEPNIHMRLAKIVAKWTEG